VVVVPTRNLDALRDAVRNAIVRRKDFVYRGEMPDNFGAVLDVYKKLVHRIDHA
jgi:hypothetical protein